MKQEEIIENNKLIAEFMGGKSKIGFFYNDGYEFPESEILHPYNAGSGWWAIEALAYNSSYDWLMTVVEKIESLEYEVNINGNDCYVLQPNKKGRLVTHCSNWSNKLECVYEAVISTIKWYNTRNK